MGRLDEQKQVAKAYLLEHPNDTNGDVAAALDISIRTVTNARMALIAEGKIKPAWGDHKRKKIVKAAETISRATEGAFDPRTTADLNAVVEQELARRAAEEPGITPDGNVDITKLKKVLWKVVHRNTDDRVVVAAASALARIQSEADARPLGPGKPLTKKDVIDRLIMMFKAVGVNLVVEALNTWMGKDTANAEKTVEQGVVAQAPPLVAGAAGDNAAEGTAS